MRRKILKPHHHSQTLSRVVVFCLMLAIVTLGVVNVWLSATVSHIGIELKDTELKRIELAKANTHIENQINEETALNDLIVKAGERGFSIKATVMRITSVTPLALR
jgi:hypothetical protein